MMECGRFVWVPLLLILSADLCMCDCITKSRITVCPYPIIVYPNQNSTFQIICSAKNWPYPLSLIRIFQLDQPQNVLLVSNELSDGPPGKVVRPSSQSPFVQRSVVSGNATFLTVTVLPAIVVDLTHSYQCEIQSFVGQGVNINKSSIAVQAGAYPGHVNLSSSLTQLSGNKTVIELNCQATAAGLVLNGMKSVSDYVFQYNHRDNWITITKADPSRRGVKLGPTVTEGVFLKRAYRLSLALKSIPTCCRRYRCYLSFRGREFKELAAERQFCLSPGQGNCNQNGGSSRGEILNIVIALSLCFLCHFVYM